jgi:hypothetical protein
LTWDRPRASTSERASAAVFTVLESMISKSLYLQVSLSRSLSISKSLYPEVSLGWTGTVSLRGPSRK